jgi:hypothetical protein
MFTDPVPLTKWKDASELNKDRVTSILLNLASNLTINMNKAKGWGLAGLSGLLVDYLEATSAATNALGLGSLSLEKLGIQITNKDWSGCDKVAQQEVLLEMQSIANKLLDERHVAIDLPEMAEEITEQFNAIVAAINHLKVLSVRQADTL